MTLSYEPKLRDVPGRAGLLVYGTVTLLAGGVSFLAALGLAVVLATPGTEPPPLPRGMMAALTVAVLVGAGFLSWLGLDILRARRWVRPVVIALAGYAALSGLASSPMTFLSRYTLQGQSWFSTVLATLALALFGVLCPAAYFFFFTRESSAAALRYFDRTPSWTDRHPLPVVALAIVAGIRSVYHLGLATVETLLLLETSDPAFAMFALLDLVQTALAVFLTVLVFRAPAKGWMLAVLLVAVAMLISIGEELILPGANHMLTQALMPDAIPPMATHVMIQQITASCVYGGALIFLRRSLIPRPAPSM